MQNSAAPSGIWQRGSQNRSFFDAMATVLLTIVEDNDNLNQRRFYVFLYFLF